MKKAKKILSVVLTLVIVLSMMPMTALAASRFPEPNGGTVNGYKKLSWALAPGATGQEMYDRIESEIVKGGYVNSNLKQHTFISKEIPASAATFDENDAYLWQECQSIDFTEGTYYIYGFGYGINVNYLVRYEYVVNVTIGYSVGISVSGASGAVVIDGANYSKGTYVVKPNNGLSFTVSEAADNTHIPSVTFDGKELSANGGTYTLSAAAISSASDRTVRVTYFDHDWQNGFCTRAGCGEYQPAPLSGGAYQISNAGQLYWFAEHVSAGNVTANAILTADITVNEGDLSTLTGPNEGLRAWMPIGKVSTTETKTYNGTFDGAGYTVNGLYFFTDALQASNGGLVGELGRNGVVKNVTVARSWFGATNFAGAIAGDLQGGIIDNCHNESYVGGAARIGGIVGHISSGTVSNCTNRGTVAFYREDPTSIITFDFMCIGGIAGNNTGTVRMCTNYGEVIGGKADMVAGIAGQTMDGRIEYSLNMATVNGNVHAGGISGWARNATLVGCINVGTVNGTSSSGSLTGGSNGIAFSSCYYVGDKATGFFETVSGAVKITVDQLYSGEIAYNLGWGQTLDGASLPYPGGPMIYRYYTSTGAFAYTNDADFVCYHKGGTATCMEPAVCSGCKTGYGEKDPQNHVGTDDAYFVNPDDTSTHFQGCPCGERAMVEEHDWGLREGVCKKCNAVCGVDTEHDWSEMGGYCVACAIPRPAELDSDGFYKISTLGELVWFAQQVNSGYNTVNGKLTKNINTVYYPFDYYEPIGRTASFGSEVEGGFAGIFDGQGYYIYGFDQMMTPDSDGTYGIFGTVADGGVVRNLVQYSAYMSLGDGTYDIRAGLIAGQVSEGGLIENCYIDRGTLKAPSRVAGGITGLNLGTVRNCYSYNVDISAHTNRFGGIVGDYQGGKVINCYTSFATIGSTESSVIGTMEGCEAGVSEERFFSGEIAYKLNGGVTDGTQPYYQILGDSKYDYTPGLHKSTDHTVYGWVNGKIELYSNSLSFTLSESLTFGMGEELNIPEGATVELSEGVILDVHADTEVEAVFTGSGHLYCGNWIYFSVLDTQYHYRICALDGCETVQQIDGTHTGGEANCTEEAVCDYCKAYYGGLNENNHDWLDGICTRCGTETSVVAWVDADGDGKFSGDEQGYSVLFYALSAGVSVKLLRDINEYFGGLTLKDQSVVVDLNGHTWNAETLSLQMSENATLTVTDSSSDKSGEFISGLMIHEAGNSIVFDGASAKLAYASLYNGTLSILGGSKVSGEVTLSGGALELSDDAYCNGLTIINNTSASAKVNIPEGHTLLAGSVEVTEIAAGESAVLSAPQEYSLGDINGDGAINGKDSNQLKQLISGAAMPSEEEKLSADVNGDGAINGIDANILAQFLSGAIGGF